jgi:hypothetical protein
MGAARKPEQETTMNRKNSNANLKVAVNKKQLAKRARPSPLPQSVASKAEHAKAERLAALEAMAFQQIARGRAANLELGRLFIQIKDIVGHGRWERYYVERFGSCGVAKRTAQTYMDLARKEDAISKSADSALFPPAMDPQGVKTRDATSKAAAKVGGAARDRIETVRLEGIFKIPLFMSIDEQEAARELIKSPDWPTAQLEIMAFLKQLYIKFGIVNSDALDEVVK